MLWCKAIFAYIVILQMTVILISLSLVVFFENMETSMHWMVHSSCRYCRHQGPLERICFTHLYRGWNEAWSSSRAFLPSTTCREFLPQNNHPWDPIGSMYGKFYLHGWWKMATFNNVESHTFFWRFIILYPVKWTRMSIHIFLNSRQLKKIICEPKIWGFSTVFPYTKLSSHWGMRYNFWPLRLFSDMWEIQPRIRMNKIYGFLELNPRGLSTIKLCASKIVSR